MDFRIADTFQDSLGRLTVEEQKLAKTTAFDLQMNPAQPSMSFHKLDRARDKNFWSVRVSSDLRLIVHKTGASLLLCYVDHHDRAYDWAERRKLETHPATGAAQFVEVRELVREVFVPVYVTGEPTPPAPARPLFAALSADELLGWGVPPEWLADVQQVADEASLLALTDHLPAEAAEALLELATGGQPKKPEPARVEDPFEHPDAQRRFRVMTNLEELQRALEFPWEKWTVFLHPDQRAFVTRAFNGPARVSGSAGTGKTVVALHRAVHLARQDPDARVLLTTFSDTLAHALKTKLRRLLGNEPRLGERIEVYSLPALGDRLYRAQFGPPQRVTRAELPGLLGEAAAGVPGHKHKLPFLLSEWDQVVDAWQLDSWEAYRDVARLGRKTRLPEAQRAVLWSIFEKLRATLSERALLTPSALFTRLAQAVGEKRPFDCAVVDEAQDVGIAHLRFLAALAGDRPNGLFLAGDLGQRIFQQPFSWKALGVDVRGRSRTLRVNYRTSHQIRSQAERLLGRTVTDADGLSEDRGTVSVFNGPPPAIRSYRDEEAESAGVAEWLASRKVAPHELGVFVRSAAELPRAREAVKRAGLPLKTLDEQVATTSGHVSVCTMDLAKGLEFRAVAVMACDDEVIPLQERIETVTDESDLQEVYDTERHLLYVACTRARDELLVTGVEPASEFVADLAPG